jgi:hypothetical protein
MTDEDVRVASSGRTGYIVSGVDVWYLAARLACSKFSDRSRRWPGNDHQGGRTASKPRLKAEATCHTPTHAGALTEAQGQWAP